MAPAPLVMNPSGLRTCGGDRAEPGPLPFSVEALLEAQRALRRAPAEPREERPRRAAEPRACFPPSVRASSPRKCPVARFGARLAQIRRTRAGGVLSLVTSESSHEPPSASAEKETGAPEPSGARTPASASASPAAQLPPGPGPEPALHRHAPSWRSVPRSVCRVSEPSLGRSPSTGLQPAQVSRSSKWAEFPFFLECSRIWGSEPETPVPSSLTPVAFRVSSPPRTATTEPGRGAGSVRKGSARPMSERPLCASLSSQAPPAPRPAPYASTSTTASRGRPSPRSSCWRWSAGSARSSTCPSPSAPRSPAA